MSEENKTDMNLLTAQDLKQRWDVSLVTIYKYANKGKRGVRLERVGNPKAFLFTPAAVEEFEQRTSGG